MSVTVKFLGASGTVTGSKYLVSHQNTKVLIDAGLFQGAREWREQNWNDPDTDLGDVDATLLTHAHIDHTGILPRYFRLGLRSKIYATKPTTELCKLLLPDSGRIQEEDAEYLAQKGRSRHKPPLPLYTERDAIECLSHFKSVKIGERAEVADGVYATWHRMGHILGAASIQLEIGGKKITFSGDIGRYTVPILNDPDPVEFGDLLLIESTYGDRLHPKTSPKEPLAEIVNRTYKRGGSVVIPSFAVGRTQLILYYLRELKEEGIIPDIPVIIDSPMASDATEIYQRCPDDYDPEAAAVIARGGKPFSVGKIAFVRDRSASIALNRIDDPMILISASGMLTGGRILHHIRHRIEDKRNTIVFVGYQPPGGKGAELLERPKSINIFKKRQPVHAEIAEISGLSAHGDRDEMVRWCSECRGTPGRVAVVHGEDDSREAFKDVLHAKFGWDVFLPQHREEISL